MFCRCKSWLIYIFMAVVTATECSDSDYITENPEPAVLILRADIPTGAAGDNASVPAHATQSPASAAPPRAACSSPPTDVATLCSLWQLSAEEKGKRLIKAANDGRVYELQMLLLAGADVGARDNNKNTALHWAAWEGYPEAARCLIGAGAELDAGNWFENTPLHWATWGGRAAVARLLLAASADPNARNQDGDTPLHLAAEHGRVEEATALLDARADRGAKNNKGKTALDRARQFNHQHWIDMLSRK